MTFMNVAFGFDIAAINADGSNSELLSQLGKAFEPTWSPDGSKIAFVSHRDNGGNINNSEIYVADPTIRPMAQATRLTFSLFQDEEPHWGPIGEYTPRRGTFDVQPPEPPGGADTTITSGPSGSVSDTTASFGFSSSKPGSTFECSLDGKAFSACTSPKVYSGLANGEHTFRVRAIDTSGKADSSPASRTWTVDITAPTVSETSPPDGKTGVARSANVTATFSEAMTASTLNKSTVKVVKKGSTKPVGTTVSYDAVAKKVTLNPNVNLASRTTYAATIKGGSTGVKDLVGNPLAQDKVWSFTTAR